MELVQGGGRRKSKNLVYNSLLDIDINQIHLNWYTLQAVVDDIATTSLAANNKIDTKSLVKNGDSQNSNDLLVLHSFQEEC